jgi:hypothetical protein
MKSRVGPDARGAAGKPPPWRAVIVTTLRLFVQRRVLRADHQPTGSHKAFRSTRVLALRIVSALVLAALTATAGGILTRHLAATHDPEDGQHRVSSGRAGPAALHAAAENRKVAASWITAQVSPGVVVACDPLMCQSLVGDGFPAGDLDQLGPGAADPLGAGVVVSTSTVRSEFGRQLLSVYAPAVLASFGSGPEKVAVLVTAPDGAAAYWSAARTDLRARRQAGAQLLRNRNVHAPPSAQTELANGDVDSRLLIAIAALAHMLPVYIRQFGGASPGADTDEPLRSVSISGAVHLARGASYRALVLAFLRAQQPPMPTNATVSGTASATVLQITVAAPSPLGLLPAPSQKSP